MPIFTDEERRFLFTQADTLHGCLKNRNQEESEAGYRKAVKFVRGFALAVLQPPPNPGDRSERSMPLMPPVQGEIRKHLAQNQVFTKFLSADLDLGKPNTLLLDSAIQDTCLGDASTDEKTARYLFQTLTVEPLREHWPDFSTTVLDTPLPYMANIAGELKELSRFIEVQPLLFSTAWISAWRGVARIGEDGLPVLLEFTSRDIANNIFNQ